MGKQIPFVMYKSGVRIVLGQASVQKDGEIIAQIPKDKWTVVKHLFEPGVGEISISPFVPARVHPDAPKI